MKQGIKISTEGKATTIKAPEKLKEIQNIVQETGLTSESVVNELLIAGLKAKQSYNQKKTKEKKEWKVIKQKKQRAPKVIVPLDNDLQTKLEEVAKEDNHNRIFIVIRQAIAFYLEYKDKVV